MATLKSATIDENLDGITDKISISVSMPLSSSERISSYTALTYFDCQLRGHAKVLFDSVVLMDGSKGDDSNGISSISLDGDIILRQLQPFKAYAG